jgi:hypothetical protein
MKNVLPKEKARTTGKRNFFLCSYILGKLNEKTRDRIGSWSNWQEIYRVFSVTLDYGKIGRDYGMDTIQNGKKGAMTRSNVGDTLTILRKSLGKRAKIKRDTTVLSKDELFELLDTSVRSQLKKG